MVVTRSKEYIQVLYPVFKLNFNQTELTFTIGLKWSSSPAGDFIFGGVGPIYRFYKNVSWARWNLPTNIWSFLYKIIRIHQSSSTRILCGLAWVFLFQIWLEFWFSKFLWLTICKTPTLIFWNWDWRSGTCQSMYMVEELYSMVQRIVVPLNHLVGHHCMDHNGFG